MSRTWMPGFPSSPSCYFSKKLLIFVTFYYYLYPTFFDVTVSEFSCMWTWLPVQMDSKILEHSQRARQKIVECDDEVQDLFGSLNDNKSLRVMTWRQIFMCRTMFVEQLQGCGAIIDTLYNTFVEIERQRVNEVVISFVIMWNGTYFTTWNIADRQWNFMWLRPQVNLILFKKINK